MVSLFLFVIITLFTYIYLLYSYLLFYLSFHRFTFQVHNNFICSHYISSTFFSSIIDSKKYEFVDKKIRKSCQAHINKHGNPLKKQFILFPRYKKDHWRLFVVANCESTKGNESDTKLESEDALKCILHMDSYASNPNSEEISAIKAIMYNFHFLKLKRDNKSEQLDLLTKNITNFWKQIEWYNLPGELYCSLF